ncbi:ribonuclease H-like domain-containing protein, partial [Tanacetum coccineum]
MGTRLLSSKECSGEAYTSEYIYEYVDACIQEVEAEHVVQIVTDNASNNMGAAALLKVTRPKIFWTSCATHTINLYAEEIQHDLDVSGANLEFFETIQHDPDVFDAVLEFFETILAGDLEMQKQVINVEMPKYKK